MKVPPGVDHGLWHQLSPNLGIALHVERGPTGVEEFYGTLMVRDGEGWRAVILQEPPPGVIPARRTTRRPWRCSGLASLALLGLAHR